MLNAIDGYLFGATGLLVRGWCALTGKDNFTLAFVLLWSSLAANFCVGVVSVVGGYWLMAFGTTMCCLNGIYYLGLCRRVARSVRSGVDVVPVTYREAKALRWDSAFFTIMGTLSFLPTVTLLGLGCYAIRNLHGGGKSIFARARDRLVDWVGSRSLVPVPAGA